MHSPSHQLLELALVGPVHGTADDVGKVLGPRRGRVIGVPPRLTPVGVPKAAEDAQLGGGLGDPAAEA